MARLSVGILRGGTSSEYDLSLKSGAALIAALPEDRYDVRDIFIDKEGYWHQRGKRVDAARALSQIDAAFVALHGGVGEDGSVQRILERAGVPYAGSRPLPSALALNKIRAREILVQAGVRMPRAASFTLRNSITTGEMARLVFEQFGPPYVVKPASEGAGHGIRIAATLIELPDAIGDVLDAFGAALVEEFIRGHDVSAAVLEGFRGEDLYALPPAHIIVPAEARFVGPAAHREGQIAHAVPSNFSHEEKRVIAEMARTAHRALGLSHFSRADLRLTPRGPYLLEVNAIPGLYPGASLPPMLESVGSSVREFAEHAIQLARS